MLRASGLPIPYLLKNSYPAKMVKLFIACLALAWRSLTESEKKSFIQPLARLIKCLFLLRLKTTVKGCG